MIRMYLLPFLLAFSICLTAQNYTFQKHETDAFREEIDEIRINSLLDETILDSIVYYQFDNELDSVRSSKKEYDRYESGEVKTRFDYLWDLANNQWGYFEKRDYSYNDNSNLTSYNAFQWDIDQSNWVNLAKMDYTYDNNGYDELIIYLKWNNDLIRWDKSRKIQTDYDENGNLLSSAIWIGDENNDWIGSSKHEWTFNPDETTKTLNYWRWGTNDDWVNFESTDYSYYRSGFLEIEHVYEWENNQWEHKVIREYVYTDSDLIEYSTLTWWVFLEWKLTHKTGYEYDENDNLVLKMYYILEDDQWVADSKNECEYDQNNNTILNINSYWPQDSDEWIYSYKYEYEFDENNNEIMDSRYLWDLELNRWVGKNKDIFVYSEQNEKLIDIDYIWDSEIDDWLLDIKGFYYRSILIDIPKFEIEGILVYPNPIGNNLFIKSQNSGNVKCTVISTSGRQIMQFNLKGTDTRISVEYLPKGIYFLQFSTDSKTTNKKIIKY